jgi:glycosyltransferase involved in cell wall biosynthesis
MINVRGWGSGANAGRAGSSPASATPRAPDRIRDREQHNVPHERGDAPVVTDARWCIVGPTHPYRGGIPRHTTLFSDAAIRSGLDITLMTFVRQYPGWLYKGSSDLDPDQVRPTALTPDYRLDGVRPDTWRRGARAIAASAPDVLVVIWWHPFFAPMVSTLLRQIRRRSPGTVRIALCHNVLPHESSPIDRFLVRCALAPAEGLVLHATSQEVVASELLGPKPALVTPHPTYTVDAALSAPRRADRDRPVNLLFFGIVRHYKGVDVLLRALPQVLRERSVRLVIAGEFWDPAQPYADLIHDLHLDGHVDLRPGYVPDDELTKLLVDADLMVAPYRSATQSGAVEMAFGAGLPVIASRVGGLADQVDDGTDGLLVPADDVASLSRALLKATDHQTLDRLSAGARSRATARTWTTLVTNVQRFSASLRANRVPFADVNDA